MHCPDENTLARRVQGLLDESEADALDRHLDGCEDCMIVWAALAEAYVDSEASTQAPASGRAGLLSRGDQVGRYHVQRLLGRGAMGVVYAARDPQLDREVALKLVSPASADEDADRDALHARAVKEARALARLSHPNVVQVLDAGRHDGEVYVALELVDGQTLGQWKLAESPQPRRILGVCRQVAEGLAAAHDAGIVHRDVKPDNVLVGANDRAWITDFGLASLEDHQLSLPAGIQALEDDEDGHRTQDGAMVGTPRFMAPEQLRGQGNDARSDQFAWCATVYWALFGEHIHPGQTIGQLIADASAGRMRSIPADARIPRTVANALRRGLSPEREDRFTSMDALLDAMQGRRFRRRSLVGAGMFLVVAAGVLWPESEPDCAEVARREAFTWPQPMPQSWVSAHDGTYVDDTWARVVADLEAYRAAWIDAYAQTCRDSRVANVPDEARFVCLRRRTRAATAALEVLATGDRELIRNATRVTASLPPVVMCARDPDVLSDLPAGVEDELRGELAKAQALRDAGRYLQAVALTRPVVARARELADPMLLVDGLLHLGAAQMEVPPFEEAEQTYREVASLAEQNHLDRRAAKAWVALVFVVGRLQGRVQDAERIVGQAEAALQRAGDPPDQRRRLHQAKGALALSRGDYEDARREFEAGFAALDEDADPMARARAYNNLGAVAARSGRFDDAVVHFDRAAGEYARVLGPSHPDIADVLHNLGVMQRSLKQYEQAEQTQRRVLEIRRNALGETNDKTAASLQALGNIKLATKDYEEAERWLNQALAVIEQLGAHDEARASTLDSLGAVSNARGDRVEALERMRQALLIRQELLGDEHPLIARSQNNLAVVLIDDGQLEEALGLLETARNTMARTYGADHPDTLAVTERFESAKARTTRTRR